MVENQLCLYCGKVLKGRSDKRYCNDDCRNAYFNERKKDEQREIRIVDHALKKNRRILKETLGNHKIKIVEEKTLLQKGFVFKYLTHTFRNSQKALYYFVYDYGYKEIEGKGFMIVRELGGPEE